MPVAEMGIIRIAVAWEMYFVQFVQGKLNSDQWRQKCFWRDLAPNYWQGSCITKFGIFVQNDDS